MPFTHAWSLVHTCSRWFALLLIATLAAAAQAQESTPTPGSNDPLEPLNRKVHAFNDTMDRWVLVPVAKGYRTITPDPVENSISNFFSNLLEVRNVFNNVLQWKWGQAGNDTGRFLVNSTVGIGGLFDVAKHINLPKSEGEDFGQTLGVWGVGPGPYIVLPFLGPSSLRDGLALPVDWTLEPVGYIDHVPTRNSTTAFQYLVKRANLLDAEAFVSGERYTFYRAAYLQRRNHLVLDGEVEDDFGDDFGGDGDYYDDAYDEEGDYSEEDEEDADF